MFLCAKANLKHVHIFSLENDKWQSYHSSSYYNRPISLIYGTGKQSKEIKKNIVEILSLEGRNTSHTEILFQNRIFQVDQFI